MQAILIDTMTTSRTITIFLASSDELINDRDSIDLFIHKLNDIYVPRGIRVECKRWEDFIAYCTGTRTQDDYNKVVAQSDICLCLFHRKAGKYTIEEFNYAMDEYKRTGDHPKTYVYARTIVDGEIEEEDLKKFKKDLFEQLGHYWCNYATSDSMKLHFVMQFERLLNGEYLSRHESNLKVERGNVLLHGKKIADFANLPFASENTEMKTLKEKIVALDKEIAEFRALNVEALRPTINAKLNERYECQKQLDQLESQLLDMAISISKMISRGDPISIRKRTAIELFEKGNNKGVLEVLNEADIASDHERAKAELVSGKQLVEAGEQLIASAEQKIRSLIDELMLKARTWMTSFSEENRFEEACKCYEQAVNMAKESLPKEEIAIWMALYGTFLVSNNQQHVAESVLVEAIELYTYLPPVHHHELFRLRATLATIYTNTQRFKEAEALLLSNYESCKQQPDLLGVTFLLGALNQLGLLYQFSRDFEKAKASLDEAIVLGENNLHEEKVRDAMPSIYGNLGSLYGLLQQPNEAIPWEERAVEAYRQLDQSDEVVQGSLAQMLSNLAFSYRNCANTKAVDIYYEALEILDNLCDKYPECYRPQYLLVLSNLCEFFAAYRVHDHDNTLLDLALEGYQEALEGYRELSVTNPKVYRTALITTLQSLSSLYNIKEQYDKAEECINEAEQIVRELEQANPGSYPHLVISSLQGKIEFYIMTKQFDKAQTVIVEAENLCRCSFAENDMTGRLCLMKVLQLKLIKCEECNELHAFMAIADEGIALCNSMISASPVYKQEKNLILLLIETLGYKFMNGNDVPQDYTEAYKYFLKAAENGHADSQERLGYMYYNGSGVKKNAAKAAEWWLQAAEQGNADAQCSIGNRYLDGDGVEQNDAEAFKWFSMAAEQGDAVAQNNVGWCYQAGKGVEQNDAEAFKWFSMAAEQGNAASQCHLGEMYENGWGVAKSLTKAKKYYTLAAKGGNEKAQENLKRMTNSRFIHLLKKIFCDNKD